MSARIRSTILLPHETDRLAMRWAIYHEHIHSRREIAKAERELRHPHKWEGAHHGTRGINHAKLLSRI